MFEIKNSNPVISKNQLKHPAFLILVLGFVFVSFAALYRNVLARPIQPVSKLLFTYGGELYNIKTTQKDVLGAVKEAGVKVSDQDSFSIARNTQLTGQSLRFTITKAWPVTIFDDNKKIIGKTTSTDPVRILEQNGVRVWPEDKIFEELNLMPEITGSVGQIIRINRAPAYNILVDDGNIEVRSWGGTIKEVIEGKVALGPRDIVEPGLDSIAVPQNIVITRINVVEIGDEVSVPFKTIYHDDWFVPKGSDKKITAGQNGTKKRLLKITYRNGLEVSRVVLSESIVQNPVTEVIKKGQMPSSHPDFKRNWWDVMVSAGTKYGLSPLALFKVAACESHVNPNSIGGGGQYLGMYQYTSGFWSKASADAGYSGAAWSDGTAQIYTTAKYVAKNGWGRWGCKP